LTFRQFVVGACAEYIFKDHTGESLCRKKAFDIPINQINEDYDKYEETALEIQFKHIAKGFLIVKEAFTKIDDNANNFIEFDELKNALHSDDSARERLAECDINMDGQISLAEFTYGFSLWCADMGEDMGFEEVDAYLVKSDH